ncbi:hypothetical protein BO82DRAFT_397288 [Aspergillus uvarum CBS 121591]|uniref:Uncharacterized protein n=1 Tax=Aspergillus uvarum CBS 121591 TaxID=1448315 RepID=A0A319CMJ9_9EURO|nr:hypothetical protein BO82DRAFT_397288 [Aspergillus uvarum CBS 121591]PYH86706.1 hypothetical protein BO82DRAFT_397288 [Aspergillus uvarum CBS 121591]
MTNREERQSTMYRTRITKIHHPCKPMTQERLKPSPIDRVCRRITLTWNPIPNNTHRYTLCRCILRRSSPSKFVPELTILISGICPRHNNHGRMHKGYGDQNYHQDPYFDQFGGYNAFRLRVFVDFPGIYLNVLGRHAFIAEDEMDTLVADFERVDFQPGSPAVAARVEYLYEVYNEHHEHGVELPEHVVELLRDRTPANETSKYPGIPVERDHFTEWAASPRMREVEVILRGKWAGLPHWAVKP